MSRAIGSRAVAVVSTPAGVVGMRGSTDATRLRKVIAFVVAAFVVFMALGVSGTFGGRALGAATTVTTPSGEIQGRHAASAAFVIATDGEVPTARDTPRTAA